MNTNIDITENESITEKMIVVSTKNNKKKIKKILKSIITWLILLILAILIVASIYYYKEYSEQDFDQIVYYVLNGVESAAPSVVKGVIETAAIPTILLWLMLCIPTVKNVKKTRHINIKIKSKTYKIQVFPVKFISNHKRIYIFIVFVIATVLVIFGFRINVFISNRIKKTSIFEEYYVDAKSANITYPEEKRNLIIIIAESMENTVLSKENGGTWDIPIVPELEKLALDNVNFSNTSKIGGANQTYGANYSVAGTVAITSGIPLKTGDILTNKETYLEEGKYLSGAYTLGEILAMQGYNLEIMLGSDSTFGGRKQYFETNGNYKVFDVNYAIQQGKMTENEKEWWGFEDDKLFQWSKEEITNLAKQGSPFNYIMVTADTHFVDGYLSKNAEKKFDSQYENVYAYSSKSINEFVEWLKKQDFYENTTIVILGDHLGMQTDFYKQKMEDNYDRTIFNVIINGVIEAKNNKNRIFTSMDMYPTILASIGIKIEGERLGIGTNLYSGEPTLAELKGLEAFNDEISKKSDWYNEHILGDDYYVMKKNTQKESEVKNEENINNNTSIQ